MYGPMPIVDLLPAAGYSCMRNETETVEEYKERINAPFDYDSILYVQGAYRNHPKAALKVAAGRVHVSNFTDFCGGVIVRSANTLLHRVGRREHDKESIYVRKWGLTSNVFTEADIHTVPVLNDMMMLSSISDEEAHDIMGKFISNAVMSYMIRNNRRFFVLADRSDGTSTAVLDTLLQGGTHTPFMTPLYLSPSLHPFVEDPQAPDYIQPRWRPFIHVEPSYKRTKVEVEVFNTPEAVNYNSRRECYVVVGHLTFKKSGGSTNCRTCDCWVSPSALYCDNGHQQRRPFWLDPNIAAWKYHEFLNNPKYWQVAPCRGFKNG